MKFNYEMTLAVVRATALGFKETDHKQVFAVRGKF